MKWCLVKHRGNFTSYIKQHQMGRTWKEVIVACFIVSLLSQYFVGKDWRKPQNMGKDSSCTLKSSSDTECVEIQYPTQWCHFLTYIFLLYLHYHEEVLYPVDWWFSGYYMYGDDVIFSSFKSSSSYFLSPICFLPGTPYYMMPTSRKDSLNFIHSF
jgi:hypothetical protein